MLTIRQSAEKTVKKFVGFSLCLLILIITCCNIFCFNCLADEVEEASSATEIASQSTEISTESITELSIEEFSEPTESTEDTTEIADNEDVSEVFYFRFIIMLLIIILFLITVSKLF